MRNLSYPLGALVALLVSSSAFATTGEGGNASPEELDHPADVVEADELRDPEVTAADEPAGGGGEGGGFADEDRGGAGGEGGGLADEDRGFADEDRGGGGGEGGRTSGEGGAADEAGGADGEGAEDAEGSDGQGGAGGEGGEGGDDDAAGSIDIGRVYGSDGCNLASTPRAGVNAALALLGLAMASLAVRMQPRRARVRSRANRRPG